MKDNTMKTILTLVVLLFGIPSMADCSTESLEKFMINWEKTGTESRASDIVILKVSAVGTEEYYIPMGVIVYSLKSLGLKKQFVHTYLFSKEENCKTFHGGFGKELKDVNP